MEVQVAAVNASGHNAIMKTTQTPRKPAAPKLIPCGPDRRLSREELLAEDARFLALMSRGPKARKNSVKLVREGR